MANVTLLPAATGAPGSGKKNVAGTNAEVSDVRVAEAVETPTSGPAYLPARAVSAIVYAPAVAAETYRRS